MEKWDIYGNVHLHQPAILAIGSKANVDMQKQTATLHNAIFRYQIKPQDKKNAYDEYHQLHNVKIRGKILRGDAVEVRQVKPKLMTLRDASITTCEPLSNAWRLKASSLRLNQETGIGTARNARLLLHGLPVFYAPYLK